MERMKDYFFSCLRESLRRSQKISLTAKVSLYLLRCWLRNLFSLSRVASFLLMISLSLYYQRSGQSFCEWRATVLAWRFLSGVFHQALNRTGNAPFRISCMKIQVTVCRCQMYFGRFPNSCLRFLPCLGEIQCMELESKIPYFGSSLVFCWSVT